MAAVVVRGWTGFCARCVHRLIWRPKPFPFSSRTSDRKEPRRTHIKKVKPEPPPDVSTLLERIFSHSRPGAAAPPAGRGQRPAAIARPARPPPSSFSAASVSPAGPKTSAGFFSQPEPGSSTDPKTSVSSEPPPRGEMPSPLEDLPSFTPSAVVEPAVGSSAEASVPQEEPIEAGPALAEGPAEPSGEDHPTGKRETREAPGEAAVEATGDLAVEDGVPHVENLEGRTAAVEGSAEPPVSGEELQTRATNISMRHLQSPAGAGPPPSEASGTRRTFLTEEPFAEPLTDPAGELPVEGSFLHSVEHETRAPPAKGPVELPSELPWEASGDTGVSPDGSVEPSAEASAAGGFSSATSDPAEDGSAELEPPWLHVGSEEESGELILEALELLELLKTKSSLDGRVEERLKVRFLRSEARTGSEASAEPDRGASRTFLWEQKYLSEDLRELEGQTATLVQELLCSAPVVPVKNPRLETADGLKSDVQEAMSLEFVTLAGVEAEIGNFESEVLQETWDALEKEAGGQVRVEKIEVRMAQEGPVDFEEQAVAEVLTLENLIETTDSLEAETSSLLGSMIVCEGGLNRRADTLNPIEGESAAQGPEGDLAEGPAEALTLESVTLAEVTNDLGNLESESLHETRDYLEQEAVLESALVKEAGGQVQEEVQMDREKVAGFGEPREAEVLTLEHLTETTDALEAETSVLLGSMIGCEGGLKFQEDASSPIEAEHKDLAEGPVEAMTLESVTLAEVTTDLGNLESESLHETRDYLEQEAVLESALVKEADGQVQEEVQIDPEEVADFGEPREAEVLTLQSLTETTDALEAETSALLGSMIGCERGLKFQEYTSSPIESEHEGDLAEGPVEAMTLESVTLANVTNDLGTLESESLHETRDYLEKEAVLESALVKEAGGQVQEEVQMDPEEVADFGEPREAEVLTLQSLTDTTDALEAETSALLGSMIGCEGGLKFQADTSNPIQGCGQDLEEGPVEAMTLESVTLAEVTTDLGTLESESLHETRDYLEQEAVLLAGEETPVVGEEAQREVKPEAGALDLLIEAGDLESLQTETVMEELLFPAAEPPDDQAEEENVLDGLDPVQKLFLDKIREYRHDLSGGASEDPAFRRLLSEETLKLQRLYGGGDLSSFPRFTFREPDAEQDDW